MSSKKNRKKLKKFYEKIQKKESADYFPKQINIHRKMERALFNFGKNFKDF